MSLGLLDATRDAGELQTRGAAARELVANEFVWSRVIERTIALYEGCLSKGHHELAIV